MEKYIGYTDGESTKKMIAGVLKTIEMERMSNEALRPKDESVLSFAIEGAKIYSNNKGYLNSVFASLRGEEA